MLKNRVNGVFNISSSKKIRLTKIAEIISVYYKKKIVFKLNKNPSYLVGNNQKLRQIYKKKINENLKQIVFND